MQRQLRRGGGIMNIAPREQFGLGSKLKRAVRKIIPNEVAKVATVAAPFVAPFNPQLAAAMAGIGGFDQTGSIGGSLKSAGLTYAGGQASRYLGGAGFQDPSMGNFGLSGFSSPLGTKTGIGKLLSDRAAAKGQLIKGQGVQPIDAGTRAAETAMETRDLIQSGNVVPGADPGTFVSPLEYKQFTPSFSEGISAAVTESAPKSVMKALQEKNYGEAAKLAAEKGFNAVFKKPIRNDAGKIIDYDLDKNTLFAAGAFGLTYLDAKKVADAEGVDIGTESEYDEATKAAKKEEYASYLTNFFEGKKDGGRIGFDEGANTKFAMIKDMLAKGMDEETIMSIAQATKEDIDSVKKERVEEAQGGRIGFANGTDKNTRGFQNKYVQAAIKLASDKNIGIGDAMMITSDEDFDIDSMEYKGSSKGILEILNKKAEGGRIGYMFGDKVEDEEGIMSMSEDKEDEDMKMAYFPGDVFSKEEVRRLFSDRSLTTNQDRKDLYKILMNPGMYPEAEKALIKMLRGNKEGGRIGFESGANKEYKFMELIEDDTDEKEKLINALLDNAREKFPEASEEDIFNFVMSKAAPMSSLMVDGKFVRSTDIETPSIKLSRDMGGPRYDFLMGGEVPVRKNKAGIEELDYRESGGFVPVGVKEKADDVPAMLSKNEFVLTADAVRGIGGGDVEKGAEKLYGVMKQAEKVGRA